MSAARLSAQGTTETKFRGCLLPGSSDGSFMLTNAVAKDDKTRRRSRSGVPKPESRLAIASRRKSKSGTVTPSTTGQPGTLKATKVSWKADYAGTG